MICSEFSICLLNLHDSRNERDMVVAELYGIGSDSWQQSRVGFSLRDLRRAIPRDFSVSRESCLRTFVMVYAIVWRLL